MLNKLVNEKTKKYVIISAILILLLTVVKMVVYKPLVSNTSVNNNNNNKLVNNTDDDKGVSIEGFKGPEFKKKKKMVSSDNPLGNFGFKYGRSEKFNNGNNDRFQNALDEAESIDVNSIGLNGIKNTIKRYNENFRDKLESVKDENSSLVSTIEQGKVFVNEFKNLFDFGLIV